MRIVFMGTPEFAVPSLERLIEAGFRPIAVVTGPDKRRGRGQQVTATPVKEAAQRLGIAPILQPASVRDPSFADEIRNLEPDLIVVVAFRILPPEVYTSARLGAFNLHGSLLPKYRGAAPINHAVMRGETETGVTTFLLEEVVDTGNVILQERMPIGPNETAGEVHDRMMELGADVVVDTVRLLEQGAVEARRQNDEEATPAPKIRRSDCRIRWDQPARQVHDQVRGLSPYPGAWTRHGDTLLKVYRTQVVDTGSRASETVDYGGEPGEVVDADGRIIAACRDGAVEILELQQEGRRRLSAEEFLHGYEIAAGDRLG